MKKIISVGAHPDDIELGMGATIAKHIDRGDEAHLILCTLGGVYGDPRTREQEALEAARLLKSELHILDYPVSKLNKPSNEFKKIIGKLVEEISPYRIYTHSPSDYHQVHFTVSNSVAMASNDIKQILYYEVISSTNPDFRPNAYVDVTNYMDVKIKSTEVHRTQSDKLYLRPNVIRSLACARYLMSKLGSNPNGMAEAFKIHKLML
jgi:LmbE family N-acetylglucosaminyl deacetylase